eukprot:6673530-Karenia_brevis.AAC.1
MARMQGLQQEMTELGAMGKDPYLTATQNKHFHDRNSQLQNDINQLQLEVLLEAANIAGLDD